MVRVALDAEAGKVSAELARRGIAAMTRVHVLLKVVSEAPTSCLSPPSPRPAAPSGSPRNAISTPTPTSYQ